jgi:molecular chaperone GrpE (heat shock protein)
MDRLAFERLHREAQEYKDNFLQKALEPVYRALISLVDHMDEVAACPEITHRDLQFLRDELLETLARQGVEPYSCEVPVFDPARQKVSKAVPVGDESLHRSIVASMKPGFSADARIIRPEHVIINRFDPALMPDTPPITQPTEAQTHE